MWFQESPTPPMDSNTSTPAADLAALVDQESNDECVDMRLYEGTAGKMGLDGSISRNPIPGEDCEEWKPVDYRGTMTRPLGYFGEFKVKPETKQLRWISDHTSGVVHPDMHTIAMLYNQDLTLPDAAKMFVEQSLVLKEEARWERVKAAFYSFHPEDVQKRVFDVLNEMLPRDASRIITRKTLRFENEIVIKMMPKLSGSWADSDSEAEIDLNVEADTCSEEDAMKLNKLIEEIAREYEKSIALVSEGFKSIKNKVSRHNSFISSDKTVTGHQVKEKSALWTNELKDYQAATRKCIEARILSHHLDNAVARYEPRTGWIHVKTQLLRRGLEENKKLPKELLGIKISSDYRIKGSLDAQNAAVDKQMAHFEMELQKLADRHIDTVDFYRNLPLWHEYEVHISYENIDPSFCQTIVRELLPQGGWNHFNIPSRPHILPYEKQHHLLVVYINWKGGKGTPIPDTLFNTTAEYKDRYGCCLNCFSRDHVAVVCEQPVYGFAGPVNATDGE